MLPNIPDLSLGVRARITQELHAPGVRPAHNADEVSRAPAKAELWLSG